MLKHVREDKLNRPYSSIFIDQQLIDDGWMPTIFGFLCPSKFACFVACQLAAAYQPQLNGYMQLPQKNAEFSQCRITFPEIGRQIGVKQAHPLPATGSPHPHGRGQRCA